MNLSKEQIRGLGYLATNFWAGMASVDGDFDDKEVDGAKKVLAEGRGNPSSTVRALAADLHANFEQVYFEWMAMPMDKKQVVLAEATAVANSVIPSEERGALSLFIFDLCKRVAEASGGGLLSLGSKISDEERTLLLSIAKTLKIPLP